MESYMVLVQKGTVLSNNDPRVGDVQIQVSDVSGGFAIYYTTRKNRISLNRIFDDGRTRCSGWSVVKQPETTI